MPQIEFQVTTDLATVANTQIETNFEAVRAWLTEELAPYASMVVTPDAIADAKKTRAAINKVKASIDDQRKAIKKLWNKPYEEYEAKCKELTGIVSDAVSNIDGQIKAMENEEKEQKRQRLSEFFDDHSYDVADFITFDDIFDSKWLNATFSEIDAANIIAAKIEEITDGLDAIRGMGSPYETAMLSEYSKTHNLAKAMAEGKRLEAIQRAEEERRAQEAERQAQILAEEKNAEESATAPYMPETEEEAMHVPDYVAPPIRPIVADEPPREKTYAYQFTMPSMTMGQMKALKQCLINNSIKYKAVRL